MNINVVDIKNKEIEKFDINFDENTVIKRKVISQVVKWQLSKRRSGTASTKILVTRSRLNKREQVMLEQAQGHLTYGEAVELFLALNLKTGL